MKFTNASIKSLKNKSERYEKWETNGRGFGLRVSPTGKKVFLFMYRYFGMSRRMTIGVYPAVTLSEARAEHAKARLKLEKGVDPGRELVEKKKGERDSSTVKGLIDEYIDLYAKPKKRSWEEDSRMLKKDVLPRWGNRKASSIKKRDIVLLLDRIAARGAVVGANRVLRLLRTMFGFAVKRGILENNPCKDVETSNEEKPRERVLSEREINKVWFGLDKAKMSDATKLAIRLLLLTGQRNGEIAGAEWKEVDLEKKWWTIPGARTKNKKDHRVFLAKMTIDALKKAKKLSGDSDWVFPSIKGNHLTPRAISRAIRNNAVARPKGQPKDKPPYGDFFKVDHFTPHDARRSVATMMAESGVDEFHISKVLNHAVSGITGKVYNRYQYDVEKQRAMEIWERKLRAMLFNEKSKVVNLKLR
jgi:integrase